MAEQLLAQPRSRTIWYPGLLNQLTKSVLDTMFEPEVTEQVGYEEPTRPTA
ncbi:hypothetical protein [Nocardia brasiliensis]|uniref:hypothetical protein n=1 Tax=Nocardia brasiliensis TaxID=37326 RepID=UPI002454EDF5|nr:hypothetical protein [Nocardia brasiliensis]